MEWRMSNLKVEQENDSDGEDQDEQNESDEKEVQKEEEVNARPAFNRLKTYQAIASAIKAGKGKTKGKGLEAVLESEPPSPRKKALPLPPPIPETNKKNAFFPKGSSESILELEQRLARGDSEYVEKKEDLIKSYK